jgi:hypothetical protein
MTYREHMDRLLRECESKDNAYIHVIGSSGQYTTYIASIKREWQKAEMEYQNCLNLIKSQKVSPDDIVMGFVML